MAVSYYFAYGSNLNPDRMNIRKAYFTERRLAKLLNYELVLNKRRVNGTAAANIRPKEDSAVYGALYTCDEKTLLALDVFEGVAKKQYLRQNITVHLDSGEEIVAVTYVAPPQSCEDTLNTVSREYLEHILCGRDILPNHYLAFLENFRSWCVEC